MLVWISKNNSMALNLFCLLCTCLLPYIGQAEELSIRQFQALAPKGGEYQLLGYIVSQYKCPPCLTPGSCAPCMPDNVLFSEVGEVLGAYPSNGAFLIINTSQAKDFKLGARYHLTVRVLQSSLYNGRFKVKDLELIKESR